MKDLVLSVLGVMNPWTYVYCGVYISPWINDSHSPGTQSLGLSVSHVKWFCSFKDADFW